VSARVKGESESGHLLFYHPAHKKAPALWPGFPVVLAWEGLR